MAGIAAPNIVKDGLVFLVDAMNPRSWTGPDSNTVNDLMGTSTGSIFNDTSGSFGANNSFTLDGTDDHINCGDPTELQIVGDFTICAWVKWAIASGNAYDGIWTKYGGTGGSGPGYQLANNADGDGFALYGAAGNINLATDDVASAGVWYNVVGTVNTSTNLAIIYVNGGLSKQGSVSSGATLSNGTDIYIGRDGGNSNSYFKGDIGPTQVYNRAITQAEVTQNYNALKGRFGL